MFGFLLIGALLHPVHETVAEIEWNARSGCLEVAIRLDVLDEQWLRRLAVRANDERAKTAKDERAAKAKDQAERWELAYLRNRFRISEMPGKNKPDDVTYRWIGRDQQRGHVWWYFEIEPGDKMPPAWLEHRVLFEKESDQSNRVVLLGGAPKTSFILNKQRPKIFLKQDDQNEPKTIPQPGR